jgi:hypothetical protein
MRGLPLSLLRAPTQGGWRVLLRRLRSSWGLGAALGVGLGWALSGCVFFQLRDELAKTQKGLVETNVELRQAGAAIGGANQTLSEQTVPAMAGTTAAIRETKVSLDGAAALREPMQAMNQELIAMRIEMAALKTQMEKTAALGPAMSKLSDLRDPMVRLASLEPAMSKVAELREPMAGLRELRDPMEQVAQLKQPLATTGQLVPPMQDLSAQLRGVGGSPDRWLGWLVGLAVGLFGLISVSTAAGVFLGLRLARRRGAGEGG